MKYAIGLILAGCLSAQIYSLPTTGSDVLISTGAIGSTSTFLTCGSTSLCAWTGTNGVPVEMRKPKTPLMTIAMVKASAHKIKQGEAIPEAYISLAKSIKLSSAAIEEAQMLNVISQLDLPVYNFEKVDEYLYEQALKMKAGTRWVWKPMRDKDFRDLHNVWRDIPGVGFVHTEQYQRPIPIPVLETVAAILEKMPDASFLVSDFSVIKPDPFLAVTTTKLLDQGKIYIVSQWDEPGFLDKEIVKSVIRYGGVARFD